jgi:hypothetical protein
MLGLPQIFADERRSKQISREFRESTRIKMNSRFSRLFAASLVICA